MSRRVRRGARRGADRVREIRNVQSIIYLSFHSSSPSVSFSVSSAISKYRYTNLLPYFLFISIALTTSAQRRGNPSPTHDRFYPFQR